MLNQPIHPHVLETPRLLLRAPSMDDVQDIERLAGDYEIARYTLNIPHPYPQGAAVKWLRQMRDRSNARSFAFAVTRREDATFLGMVGIHAHERFNRAEIGYWIGIPYWGRGYMTEAARRVLQFGFEKLNLTRIQATYLTENPASRRVMEKIGMTYEGTLRAYIQKWDKDKDLGMCAILRSEWEAQS